MLGKRARTVHVYYGDVPCQAKKGNGDVCTNGAYFALPNNSLVCGMHSKRQSGAVELPKRSIKDKTARADAMYAAHRATVEAARNKDGTAGSVSLTKLLMMHNAKLIEGVLNIFPNYKHAGKRDGLGLRTLSPKYLGPVEHGQPGVGAALNIENFHQGSKCFPAELDVPGDVDTSKLTAQELTKYDPLPVFWATRAAMFADPEPHRHKATSGGVNAPAYFVWVSKDGAVHKLSYVASRQFYCTYFERLVRKQEEFVRLVQLRADGTHLNLVGYDARPVAPTAEAIEAAYLDASAPFGHELVLLALLVLAKEDWPWRKHATFI